jgi:hypothetical protein
VITKYFLNLLTYLPNKKAFKPAIIKDLFYIYIKYILYIRKNQGWGEKLWVMSYPE